MKPYALSSFHPLWQFFLYAMFSCNYIGFNLATIALSPSPHILEFFCYVHMWLDLFYIST